MNISHPFSGVGVEPEDVPRLKGQLERVRRYMKDGDWHTIPEIAAAVGASQTSASARVRDLRKARFGGHTIERIRDPYTPGRYWYRLMPRRAQPVVQGTLFHVRSGGYPDAKF